MLAAAGIVDLFVRMVVSLLFVLAIVAVAYFAMRRRAGLAGRVDSRFAGRRQPGASRQQRTGATSRRTSPRRNARQQVEVLGRVGLTRSSSAVVLKFADRVILVGASEQAQPTVLAEVDAATWELIDQDTEWTVPLDVEGQEPATAPPGFMDALREATVRRA